MADECRLTKHALTQYLDPAREAFLDLDGNEKSREESMDDKGQQLFYKLANLDDRIKNADQVCPKYGIEWILWDSRY